MIESSEVGQYALGYPYDWNNAPMPMSRRRSLNGLVLSPHCEQMRDGLQATYLKSPTWGDREYYFRTLPSIGITSANIGFTSPKPEHQKILRDTAVFIRDNEIPLDITAAGRTDPDDIEPLIKISQETGMPFEMGMFINSKLIANGVLGLTFNEMLDNVRRRVALAKQGKLRVMFVVEDVTRTDPETLSRFFGAAIDEGVEGIAIADTVGILRPRGASKIVRFVRKDIVGNKKVKIDFHNHNDLGIATENAMTAYESGVDRVHSTWFGTGERNGNVSTEQLLVNLYLEGARIEEKHLANMGMFRDEVAVMLNYKIPPNLPILGSGSYSSATGAHGIA
jgi:isopropylmalate/homocitrate/citramalate synthase